MKNRFFTHRLTVLMATVSCVACVAFGVQSVAGDEKNSEQLSAVLALEGDSEFGEYLAGECLTCHQPGGGDGSIPLIHGKDKAYLASALLEYKNKQRENLVMRGVSAALTDEELASLVSYFSEQ